MKLYRRDWIAGFIVTTLLTFGAASGLAQDSPVKSFPTYRAAADAFVSAVKADDNAALKEILGAQAQDLLSSGDTVADENGRAGFLKGYEKAHAFVHDSPDSVTMTIGSSAWPLPFPIVKADGAWHFDALKGAQELAYRRIGENELAAIKVCRALRDAQKVYAETGHDGDPPGVFAQRIVSSPGKQNGLYWETKEGEDESPAGSLIADATSEGYDIQQGKKPVPFYGYYYRVLKSQGEHAIGGAKDYIRDGKMTGGFAIVAWPADYGPSGSGVMTFVIGRGGKVFQKDLGQDTAAAVRAMTAYDPDSSWKIAR
jgi:Protein of unknown function (DUF2950)